MDTRTVKRLVCLFVSVILLVMGCGTTSKKGDTVVYEKTEALKLECPEQEKWVANNTLYVTFLGAFMPLEEIKKLEGFPECPEKEVKEK